MIPRGPHLGALVSDLVDGQLTVAETELALAHVVVCSHCSAELEASRSARLAVVRTSDVVPDAALVARLLALAGATPLLGQTASATGPGVGQRRPSGRVLTGEVGSRTAARQRAAAITGIAVAAAAAVLFALGGEPLVAPSVHPGVAQRLLAGAPFESESRTGSTLVVNASATVSDGAPGPATNDLAEPASQPEAVLEWLRAHRWTAPSGLPAGLTVTAIRSREAGGSVLELDLAHGTARLVVLEQRGRLDPSGFSDVVPQRIRDREVYVVASTPWHLVWQSGGTVVTVIAEAPSDVIEDLVAAFPLDGNNASVPGRISRGWAVMTGAVQ